MTIRPDDYVESGQEWEPYRAAAWNALLDHAQESEGTEGDVDESPSVWPKVLTIKVQAPSANVAPLTPVGWGSPLVDVAGGGSDDAIRTLALNAGPIFSHAAPVEGRWGVTERGMQGGSDALGVVVVVGSAWAQVNIQSDAHGWADINDAGDLVSTVGGYAKILYKPTGTGLKWCALQLGFGGGKKPRLGKADADVAKDASGTFTIQIGEPGSLVASTETETAFALCAIKLGDVVALIEVADGAGGCFYLALSCGTGSAECICALDAMLQLHKGLIDALDARVTVLEP